MSLLIAYQLKDKKALLIGGGEVAHGRLVHLLHAGATVTLVAPRSELHPDIVPLLPHVTHIDRLFRLFVDADLITDSHIVLTAIGDSKLSTDIARLARRVRVPVNVADVPDECDFYFGSVIRRGALEILVSTNGRGPRIARRVRQQLEHALPEGISDAIDNVSRLRSAVRSVLDGNDKASVRRRMTALSQVCDDLSWNELAHLSNSDIERIVRDIADGRPSYSRAPHLSFSLALPESFSVASFTLGAATSAAIALAYWGATNYRRR